MGTIWWAQYDVRGVFLNPRMVEHILFCVLEKRVPDSAVHNSKSQANHWLAVILVESDPA